MAKRTEQHWRELFRQHDESGLTAAEFCMNNKLCSQYFSLRHKQLSGEPGTIKSVRRDFVRAKPPSKSTSEKNLTILSSLNCQSQVPNVTRF